MRIAQVAPIFERVPPKLYGGTERVVSTLTEELVRRGHDVTLFATADSQTSARLVPMAETGTRIGQARDPLALHVAMLEEVYARVNEFDVIHSHVDILAFPFARECDIPTLTTMHGRLDFPEHRRVLGRFPEQPLISISHSQRAPLSDLPLRWVATIHHGIQLKDIPFRQQPDTPHYLAFLGRISPEKGPDRAIEIARRAGIPLKIAAKIDPADRVWAEQHFLPLLGSSDVEYIGEVDELGKAELLGGALALLFPIDWPEPFGLVMIESLACGTPVIAMQGGSVNEILVDGKTGFICRSLDEMTDAVWQAERIDRYACRRRVEAYFSAEAMASAYETCFRRIKIGTADWADRTLIGTDRTLPTNPFDLTRSPQLTLKYPNSSLADSIDVVDLQE